ncbi:MAG: sodium/proton-translocating pyrophosphatase, partial [Candidatus Gracilibacteria bacterium]
MSLPLLALGISGLVLVYAIFLVVRVLKFNPGTTTMQDISEAIKEGAMAFLNRQFKTIAVIAIIIFLIIGFGIPAGENNNGYLMAFGFLVGAFFSGLAGYIGMGMSVRANVRTANAAKTSLKEALTVAVRGGSVTGFAVVGLALAGVSGFYYLFTQIWNVPVDAAPELLLGFGFGASLVSLFARVGGGIYTKAADVGADLVGKVEKGIPEDDPRNPAVIADNVGDNVGDCAGMGADLFESYVDSIIVAMVLGALSLGIFGSKAVILPLAIAGGGILASLVGNLIIRLIKKGESHNILNA